MKIFIAGKSASGKDWLIQQFYHRNYKIGVKYTSRPKRDSETHGIHYDFITNQEFNYIKNRGYMPIHQEFIINDVLWQYGFSNDKLNSSDVFILTPHEIQMYINYIKSNNLEHSYLVIYLNIDENVRRERLLSRNDNNDDVERRIKADDKDFKDFEQNVDIEITNSDFNFFDILNSIEQINI